MAGTEENLATIVRKRLKELRKRPSHLGTALGYKYGYDAFHKIFVTKKTEFTKELQERAADFLEWPRDKFANPWGADEREQRVRQAYQEFLDAGGSEFDKDVLRTLESMRFYSEKRLPTKRTFQALAIFISGDHTMAEIGEALKQQEEIDKLPPPPRKRGAKKLR